MSMSSLNNVLAARAAILERSASFARPAEPAARSSPFGAAIDRAIDAVNASQMRASQASAAFERGETDDIAGVMLARQHAAIEFQATLQVRNRLLSAYKDIMNMPL